MKTEKITKAENTINECPEFKYFGAPYPDARCIDGFLWDLDKCDDGGLYGGGEEPCPFCNEKSFIERHELTQGEYQRYIERLRK